MWARLRSLLCWFIYAQSYSMPSQERFRARPMWACLEPCPMSQNYQFCVGQQPKPQICCWFGLHKSSFRTMTIESLCQTLARPNLKFFSSGNARFRCRIRAGLVPNRRGRYRVATTNNSALNNSVRFFHALPSPNQDAFLQND